jgi:hypothetical protein
MAEQFDANSEVQKILDVANRMADVQTKEERYESAVAADNLRGELCALKPQELEKTMQTLIPRSDDAEVIRDKDGKVTGLTFRVTDYWFIGMDLECRHNR